MLSIAYSVKTVSRNKSLYTKTIYISDLYKPFFFHDLDDSHNRV